MSAILSSKIENAVNSLLKAAELAAKYGAEDTKNINTYTDMIKELSTINCGAAKSSRAIAQSRNAETVEEFQRLYDAEMNQEIDPTSTRFYRDCVEDITDALRTDEDVIAEQSTSTQLPVSDIDPITKKRMVNPVRNRNCSHYYEKSSILQSIEMNPRYKCPNYGCGNNEFITVDDLIEDHSFKRLLKITKNNSN